MEINFSITHVDNAGTSSFADIPDCIQKIKKYHDSLNKNSLNNISLTQLNDIYQTLDKQGIIQLQPNDSFDIILNKFLTKLCYIAYRHDINSEEYKTIKSYIDILQPKFRSSSIEQLRHYLKKQEEINNDYFGSYLSDDSDSEEFYDKDMEELSVPRNQLENAGNYLEQNLSRLLKQEKLLKRENIACLPSLKERQSLSYKGIKFEEAKIELEKLNKRLKQGESINQILPTLKTQFFVGQYRGITYFLNKWNQISRQNHRNKNERFEHYYSEAVYLEAGYENLHDFYKEKEHSIEQQIKLFSKANILKGKLINLKTAKNCNYKLKKYDNYKDVLQEIYTNGYQSFKKLIAEDKILKKMLPKGGIPVVSTADTPNHALHYAYALKAYSYQKKEIIQPRWNKSGKAERAYAGKCCVFLIQLNTFDSIEYPNHLVSKNWNAEVEIPDYIVAERETSFDAYIDKNNVIIQHVAKYPSFNNSYKHSFLNKYGMDEKLYSLFQKAVQTTRRHTQEWKNLKILIGEWLCYVHEIRLIKKTQAYTENKGGVIVYHDNQHNQFSFQLPLYTPRGNYTSTTSEQKKILEEKIQARKAERYYSKISYIGSSSNNNQINDPDDSQMSQMALELSLNTNDSSLSRESSQAIDINSQKNDELHVIGDFRFFQQGLNEGLKQQYSITNSQPDIVDKKDYIETLTNLSTIYLTGTNNMNETFLFLKKYIKENNYDTFVKELEKLVKEKRFDINYQYEHKISAIKGNKIERDIDTLTKQTLLHVALKLRKLLFVKRLLELNADPTIMYSKNGTVRTSYIDGYTGSHIEDGSLETIKKNITIDKLTGNNIPLLALLKVYGLEIATNTMNQKNKEEFEVHYLMFLEEKNKNFSLQAENNILKSKLTDLDKVYNWKETEQSVIKIQSIFKKVGAKRKLDELQEIAKNELKNKAIKFINRLLETENYDEAIDLTKTLSESNYQSLRVKLALFEKGEKINDVDNEEVHQPSAKKLKH